MEKRDFSAPRAGNDRREQAPEHGMVAEGKEQKAKGKEHDPQDGELDPENRPLVRFLAGFGAQTDGEEDGKNKGRRQPCPHHRRPYPG
jgi:hypothetical protein